MDDRTRCAPLVLLGPVSSAAGIGGIGWGEINSSEEPGSVLVRHTFITGTVAPTLPASAFEFSVICPPDQICATGEGVRLHGQWVCPADPTDPQQRCPRQNFDLHPVGSTIPVLGTVWFNPTNAGPRTRDVFTPPCTRGYLILSVVDDVSNPSKFDGLIGDAVIRDFNGSVGAYNADPVQAASTVAHKAIVEPVDPVTGDVTGRNLVTGPDMRKGLVRSVKAEKVTTPVARDLGDTVGPVPLIGIIDTKEHNALGRDRPRVCVLVLSRRRDGCHSVRAVKHAGEAATIGAGGRECTVRRSC